MKRPLVVLALTAPLWALPGSSVAVAQTPSCSHPTIVGTAHGDRLVGTNGPDVIVGLGGHDVLIGRGGNDVLCGGAGADVLDGGSGRDRLRGGPDRIVHDARIGKMSVGDRLDGGPGNDLLDGGHDRRTDSIDLSNAEPDLLDYRDAPDGVTVRLDQGRAQGYGNDRIVVRGRYEVRTTPYPDVVYGSDFQELISTRGGTTWSAPAEEATGCRSTAARAPAMTMWCSAGAATTSSPPWGALTGSRAAPAPTR